MDKFNVNMVLTLFDPVMLKQTIIGTTPGGLQITPGFLLAASILMEIPIMMVLLSRILKYRANRWANIIAGTIMSLVQILTVFSGAPTIYYLFFSAIEVPCTLFIVWYAWWWRNPEDQP